MEQGLVRELRRTEIRLAVDRGQHRLRTEDEPCTADLRYVESGVLRDVAGCTAGSGRRDLYRLLHGPEPAPQGQAGDRTDGSDADSDSGLLRRSVFGAVCRGASAGDFQPVNAAADRDFAGGLHLEPSAGLDPPARTGWLGKPDSDPGDSVHWLVVAVHEPVHGSLVLRR